MAAIAFPSTPSVNDIFTSGTRKWKWTGTRWQVMPVTIPPSRLSGEGAEVGDVLAWDGEQYSPAPISGSSPTIARSAWASPYHYYGTAPSGTAESASGWTITRLTTDADGAVTATATASGAWSNRASLSYS